MEEEYLNDCLLYHIAEERIDELEDIRYDLDEEQFKASDVILDISSRLMK